MSVTNNQSVLKPQGKIRYTIWIVMFFVFFVAYLDRGNNSVLIASENYVNALGISGDKGAQGLLMTAFLFFYGLASFFVGPVINRFGPRKILIYSLFIWVIILCVMGFTSSFYIHLGCRALLGLSEAVAGPVCSKLIHTWFPPKERAKANAAWFVGLNFSLLAGIPFIGLLISELGWHGSFYTLAILNFIPILACLILVYDKITDHPRISDAEKQYILSDREHQDVIESNSTTSFQFLKKTTFWYSAIVYAMNLSIFWGISSWLPAYLKTSQGLTLTKTGGLAAAPYIANILFLLLFTPLMDKLNIRAAFTAVGCISASIFLYFVSIAGNPMISLVFIALGFGCITMANCSLFPILQNELRSNELAIAIGFFTGIAYVTSSAFPYVMGAIYSYTGSMTAGFELLVGTGILSAFAAIPMAIRKL